MPLLRVVRLICCPTLVLVIADLLGGYCEAGGEDDDPFNQVFQLLQVLQSKHISLMMVIVIKSFDNTW